MRKRNKTKPRTTNRTSPTSFWGKFKFKLEAFASASYRRRTWITAAIIFVACFVPFGYLPSQSKEISEYNRMIDENTTIVEDLKLANHYTIIDKDVFIEWSRITRVQVEFLQALLSRIKDGQKEAPDVGPLNQSFLDAETLDRRLASIENELRGVRFYSVYRPDCQADIYDFLDRIPQMRRIKEIDQEMGRTFNSFTAGPMLQSLEKLLQFLDTLNKYLEETVRRSETSKAKGESRVRRLAAIYRECESRVADLENREMLIQGYSWLLVLCSAYIAGFIITVMVGIIRWPMTPSD